MYFFLKLWENLVQKFRIDQEYKSHQIKLNKCLMKRKKNPVILPTFWPDGQ